MLRARPRMPSWITGVYKKNRKSESTQFNDTLADERQRHPALKRRTERLGREQGILLAPLSFPRQTGNDHCTKRSRPAAPARPISPPRRKRRAASRIHPVQAVPLAPCEHTSVNSFAVVA